MRYISLTSLKPGMMLGKSVFNNKGDALLMKGTPLTLAYIERLQSYLFPGIYIDDPFTNDIQTNDVVDERLRVESIQKVKALFVNSVNDIDDKSFRRMNEEFHKSVNSLVDEIILNKETVVNMMDLKTYDDYTYQHSTSVCILSVVVGLALGLGKDKLVRLGLAAAYHDLGKMKVRKEVLEKPGKLTDKEFDEMKLHPQFGYEIVKGKLMQHGEICVGVFQHHEKYDGTGYPSGKAGKDIYLYGRIIAVADVYDALTTKRPYRNPMLPSEVMEYIMSNSGRHFDPDVVSVFLKKVAAYPVGMMVKLSNGQKGVVAQNFESFTLRPKIKLYTGNDNDSVYINLKDDPAMQSVTIVEIIRE